MCITNKKTHTGGYYKCEVDETTSVISDDVSTWELRSSGLLRIDKWEILNDYYGQPVGHIFQYETVSLSVSVWKDSPILAV